MLKSALLISCDQIATNSTIFSMHLCQTPFHLCGESFSCSGSVELTESKAVSVDYEKANSLSSDEGVASGGTTGGGLFGKRVPQNSPTKLKALMTTMANVPAANVAGTANNTLAVQPVTMSLGQSLPNLNLNSPHSSQNTLLVPGSSGHSNLLSPSHRGISYPPPSPSL